MKFVDSLASMTIWGKTHRLLLLITCAALALLSVFGWFYVVSPRQVSTTAPTVSNRNQTNGVPSLSVPTTDNSETIPQIDVQTITEGSADSPASTQVEVNGQSIPMPETGSVEKVIQLPSGTASVTVSVDNKTEGTSRTSSSTSVDIQSSSEINQSSNNGR